MLLGPWKGADFLESILQMKSIKLGFNNAFRRRQLTYPHNWAHSTSACVPLWQKQKYFCLVFNSTSINNSHHVCVSMCASTDVWVSRPRGWLVGTYGPLLWCPPVATCKLKRLAYINRKGFIVKFTFSEKCYISLQKSSWCLSSYSTVTIHRDICDQNQILIASNDRTDVR